MTLFDPKNKPQRWWWILGIAGLGAVIGAVMTIGTNAVIASTNTEAFCTSCHEMHDNVYAEYKGTIHDTNRSGVRATCADCHVPKELGPKLITKIKATTELWAHFMGAIDTPEKFEKHRHAMATNVWKRMQANDSRECRSCHTADKMSPQLQTEKAQTRHAKGKEENLTCIDCHFGIAHSEPEGPGPRELRNTSVSAARP